MGEPTLTKDMLDNLPDKGSVIDLDQRSVSSMRHSQISEKLRVIVQP